MKIDRNRMTREEKTQLELHSLYQKYGYSRFKMGKFEDYDLYVRNRDFIAQESIITFSDRSGKLLALKPDLTLSIVKNYRYQPGITQKVYYSENIYRASKVDGSYRELTQTGLECMGDVGLYDTFEVTMMALKSLSAISSDYVLEISHMGVLADLLSNLEEGLQARLLKLIGEKNSHDLERVCQEEGVAPELVEALKTVVNTYGDYRKVLKKLSTLPLGERGKEALQQLSDVVGLLSSYRMTSKVNLDFSIVNDLTYYSGILFKGYIAGIPQAVLSGGRYDTLMGYMGKKGGAIGFGVYLDELDRLDPGSRDYDVDVLFQYTLEDDLRLMYKVIRELIHGGQTVLAEKEIPEKLKYRKRIRLEGNEVITVEEYD